MNTQLEQLSTVARQAVQRRNWVNVRVCAARILELDPRSAEGHFLLGLAEKAAGETQKAADRFAAALSLDERRYDAAIELAGRYAVLSRQGDAAELLDRYASRLGGSPLYLNMAADTYTRIGLHLPALPLYQRACELQPEIEMFQSNLAACAVLVGRIDEAGRIYRELLQRHPDHQRHHYELARLERARDDAHVKEMQAILARGGHPDSENIFMYYALGKELEDLERWDEAFAYYERAGTAARRASPYDVRDDVALIDAMIEVCNADWIKGGITAGTASAKRPVFIVGLPRSGTTLVERILSSHSFVESVDETFFIDVAIRRAAGASPSAATTPPIVRSAAREDPARIASDYLESVRYKLGDKPLFIEKLPENFTSLGFIARAFPDAHLLHVRRNPLDVCFAMYKQPYFRFAYSFEDLGTYYLAFERLRAHWRRLLGERLIELDYERLTSAQETETRRLLERLGLPFEQACIEFEQNERPSATASSVQVREKVHTRSVLNWKHFEAHLAPLRERLEQAGIGVEPSSGNPGQPSPDARFGQ